MTKPGPSSEIDLFIHWLDTQRSHAIGILDGLSEENLRRPITSSGWSCLGMIGHLTAMERFWYRKVILGELGASSAIPVSIEWLVPDTIATEAVFASYRDEIALANSIIRATPIDAVPAWWPDFFTQWRLHNLREVLLHTMTETATHAGHLDAARESIDRRQWFVLDV